MYENIFLKFNWIKWIKFNWIDEIIFLNLKNIQFISTFAKISPVSWPTNMHRFKAVNKKISLKLKCLNDEFASYKHAASYQLFALSFWRHPFTAQDPLVNKWCNAKFSKSFPVKKQIHLYLGWPESE